MNISNVVRFTLRPALAVLVSVSLAAPAAAQPVAGAHGTASTPLVVVLDSVNASGAYGTATVEIQPGEIERTVLTLRLEGLQPHAAYIAHVHAGTPDAPSASFGLLGTLDGDADGRATLETSTVSVSAAGQVVDLSVDLLTDGEHLIDVHTAEGGSVAAGVIAPVVAAP